MNGKYLEEIRETIIKKGNCNDLSVDQVVDFIFHC